MGNHFIGAVEEEKPDHPDPVRTVVTKFKGAECVPVRLRTEMGRRREHGTFYETRSMLRVFGAEMPGGTIILKYLPDGPEAAAAHPGDYIYPTDVRFDRTDEQLYV